ncbi:MAG: PAS domain S-box protein [Desulfovibrio sp.]|nr:PAS domain S-box protein [Desulfovibrio sp.]
MRDKKENFAGGFGARGVKDEELCAKSPILCTDKLFLSAFSFASIGMSLIAPDGQWIAVNNALCNLVGYSEAELLSKKFQDITHPEDVDEALTYFQQILSHERETYQREKRYIHKNGGIVFVLLNVSLVRDDDDKPLFFISQAQDITAQKKKRERADTPRVRGLSDRGEHQAALLRPWGAGDRSRRALP